MAVDANRQRGRPPVRGGSEPSQNFYRPMKQLLFISYRFPPESGSAAQRSLRFVEHLPLFGIRPTVLTDAAAASPGSDPDAAGARVEFPGDITIARTPWPAGAHPGRSAAEARRMDLASRLIEKRALEAIFVSMSPFSDASFAARLSARHGIPWIADLRDPWALDEFQVYRSRWHRQRAFRTMRRALVSASLIVMNTPEAAATLTLAFPEFAGRTISVTNGFDADLLVPPGGGRRDEFFRIVHSGFFQSPAGVRQRRQTPQYRLLGRVESGIEILPCSHYYLLQALAQWQAEDPQVDRHVRLVLAGEPRPLDREFLAHSPVATLARFAGHLPPAESAELVRNADLLFLPMHKLPPGRRATIVPPKLYEYLASGRPILAAVPQGDARDMLAQAGTGLICEPDDVGQMIRHLRRQLRLWLAGETPARFDLAYVSQFESRELTRQLASHLHRLNPPAPRGAAGFAEPADEPPSTEAPDGFDDAAAAAADSRPA